MKLLLDTCTFLWMVSEPARLSPAAAAALRDPASDVFLSPVSAWEVSVKYALGRLPLPEPPERYVPRERERHRIAPLPLDEDAVLHLHRLPALHRDPFDRMLVCQALSRALTVVTPDEAIQRYPVRCLW
jgi:PIN domain nuclease of toxin-antitoxin system